MDTGNSKKEPTVNLNYHCISHLPPTLPLPKVDQSYPLLGVPLFITVHTLVFPTRLGRL